MNVLQFVKFQDVHKDYKPIVFLVTVAHDTLNLVEATAEAKARLRINPDYEKDYVVIENTTVCSTPDDVEGFEPC